MAVLGVCLGGSEPPSQTPELVRLGVLSREPRLLTQQLHGQGVRHHHDDHWHVERHERTEDEEGAVVDDAQVWLRHYVARVVHACW